MSHRIFVAGGSGTIGVPLVRALLAHGHHVTALTRSEHNRQMLQAIGASVAVADALDANALRDAVTAARPTHVIHQLTALPKEGPRRARDLEPTNRLRIEGTRNLIVASLAAGAKRLIAGSFAPLQGLGPTPPRAMRDIVEAINAMESQVLEADRNGPIEGVILRYGLFYGPDNPATQKMLALTRRRMLPVVSGDASLLPCIHIDDAVSATVAAVDYGTPGSAYDIVDDEPVSMTDLVSAMAQFTGAPPPRAVPAWLPRLVSPYLAQVTSLRVHLSNDKAKTELYWRPAYPTIRDGLAQAVAKAA